MFSRVLTLAGAAAVLGALLSTAIPVQLGSNDQNLWMSLGEAA